MRLRSGHVSQPVKRHGYLPLSATKAVRTKTYTRPSSGSRMDATTEPGDEPDGFGRQGKVDRFDSEMTLY